jgi:hypothetical protein
LHLRVARVWQTSLLCTVGHFGSECLSQNWTAPQGCFALMPHRHCYSGTHLYSPEPVEHQDKK